MKKFDKHKANYDFQRLYRRGKSFVSPSVVTYVRKLSGNRIRLGITASKKLGSAVARNRAKRVITAAFRGCLPRIRTGYDFVIVARTRILSVKSTVVQESIMKLIKKANLCCELQDENNIN